MSIFIKATYTGKSFGPFEEKRTYDLKVDENINGVSIMTTALKKYDTQARIEVLQSKAEETVRTPKRYSSLAEFFGDWTEISVTKFS